MIFLATFFLFSQAFAGLPPTTVKGQSETNKTTTFNIEAPYNQATTTGSSTRLVETGNNNLLLNASFEHSTPATSWTLGSGVSSAVETTEVKDGKKALTLTLTAATGDILCQNVTPTIKLQGSNMEHALRVKTTLTTLQVCAQNAGSTVGTCANVAPDDISKIYNSIVPGPSSGSVGVCLRATGSTSGTVTVDDGYTGYARNIAFGVPPNTFTAQVSATGVVSDETGGNWINGNCTQSAGNFDCPFSTGVFTSAPNCIGSLKESSSGDQTMNRISADTVSASVYTRTGAGTGTSIGFQIQCTKTGSDYIQPAITAPNYDYSGKNCTVTGGWSTNTSYTCKESRRGSYAFYDITVATSGTPTAAILHVNLPAGRTVNTNLLTSTSSGFSPFLSTVEVNDSNTAIYGGYVTYRDTTSVAVKSKNPAGGGDSNITNTFPIAFDSSDFVYLNFMVPIVEFGETQSAPQLVNSVITQYNGVNSKIESELNCDASSSITSQSGGISTIGNRSGNTCALTLTSGVFTANPWKCQVTVKSTTVQATGCTCSSATSCTIAGPSADFDAYVSIEGPK